MLATIFFLPTVFRRSNRRKFQLVRPTLRVRSDRSAIKPRDHFASPLSLNMPLKQQPLSVTLRFHKTASCAETKSNMQNDLRTKRQFCVKHSGRIPG